jgi:regulator of protease activity HflC (stomatin/prohibitin superfamily)
MSTQIDQIKKDMQVTAWRVNFVIKVVFWGSLVFLAVEIAFFWKSFPILGFIFSGFPIILFFFALFGLMIIQPEERWMVEFLGKPYCIKKPGLRWYCPGLMHKRMIIDTWEQKVLLFPERKFPNGVHIDLKNGGKTQLVDPILWVQLIGAGTDQEEDSVLRMVYSIDDWKDAVEENGENALRTHLNNLTVDEVLTAIHSRGKESWWEEVSEYFPGLDGTIKGYGIEAKRLTISDFNWDEKVVAARQKIFEEERSIALAKLSVKAAKDEVLQKALESGGLYGEIVRILMQKKYGLDRKEAMLAAESLVLYYKGAETKSLVDVRTPSGGDFASIISSIIATVRGSKIGDKKSEESPVEEMVHGSNKIRGKKSEESLSEK